MHCLRRVDAVTDRRTGVRPAPLGEMRIAERWDCINYQLDKNS